MARLSISHASGPFITLEGRRLVSFGGCNYLGLSFHPDVQAALIRGLEQFGISTSASRETTGNSTAHDQLEESLRRFLGVEGAVVVPDGYTANLAAAQALSAEHGVALIDDRCHRSIREAVTCSGMHPIEFRHLDAADAAAKLAALQGDRRTTVWTDGVFASDGAIAPIPRLLDAARRANAMLVIDDCHGFCTLGPAGRGTLSHFGLADPMPRDVVITTTLAKGLGCHGGVVAGADSLAEAVRARAIAYICTTPASPAIAAAAAEAISVIERNPDRVRRLHTNADHLGNALRAAGIEVLRSPAPIFAFTLPTVNEMKALARHLRDSGFLAPLIDYPDGPAPCYFRLSVISEHTPEQIEALTQAMRAHMTPGPREAISTPVQR